MFQVVKRVRQRKRVCLHAREMRERVRERERVRHRECVYTRER